MLINVIIEIIYHIKSMEALEAIPTIVITPERTLISIPVISHPKLSRQKKTKNIFNVSMLQSSYRKRKYQNSFLVRYAILDVQYLKSNALFIVFMFACAMITFSLYNCECL